MVMRNPTQCVGNCMPLNFTLIYHGLTIGHLCVFIGLKLGAFMRWKPLSLDAESHSFDILLVNNMQTNPIILSLSLGLLSAMSNVIAVKAGGVMRVKSKIFA
jgi:hypothetical protein